MATHIVPDASGFDSQHRQGKVVLESDIVDNFPQAIEELHSSTAAEQALVYASQQFGGRCGVSGSKGHYPVDVQGQEIQDTTPPSRYRIDIPVAASLA